MSPQLNVILLAAGPSTRLGQPKQLVKIDGETLVHRTARLLLGIEPKNLVVVTGCKSERIEEELQDLPVTTVFNKNWDQGMGGSIACGARHIVDGLDGVMVIVCDQWRMEQADFSRLISEWSADISRIYVASWKEGQALVTGPPVLFPGKMLHELKYIEPTRGARQVIDRFIEIVEFVELENAAYDLDRPEDLLKVRGELRFPSS